MPTISYFRGIRIFMNWRDHLPAHFHAEYSGMECCISIDTIEMFTGDMEPKQLKIILGWAAIHQEELQENWTRAMEKKELLPIDPI